MTLIANGKIWALACELNVVHHCNLACRACSHQSPQATAYFSKPDQVWRDLSTLAKHYHCRYVRLVGGEPLLHPALLEIVEAVANSRIADYVRVKTNGTRLSRMPDRFWASVKEVHVSIYPGFEPTHGEIEEWKRHAAEHHTRLKLIAYPNFNETYAELGTQDHRLVRQIYATCRPAHLWHCHIVAEGYFFKCPASWVLAGMPRSDTDGSNPRDGLRINSHPTFLDDLTVYLSSNEPLTACHNCLGSVGKTFPHAQATRHAVGLPRSTEELIDRKRLDWLRATRLPRTWLFTTERMLDSFLWRKSGWQNTK